MSEYFSCSFSSFRSSNKEFDLCYQTLSNQKNALLSPHLLDFEVLLPALSLHLHHISSYP